MLSFSTIYIITNVNINNIIDVNTFCIIPIFLQITVERHNKSDIASHLKRIQFSVITDRIDIVSDV